MTVDPVGEHNGHFDDGHTLPPEAMGHLDLEAVTVGADLAQVDGQERAAAKTFVAAGRVGKRHAGDDSDVRSSAFAEHQSAERPVDDAEAGEGTRDEYHVG